MPNINLDDTIAAIATPVGEGGIAVLRLSGPEALQIISRLFHPKKGPVDSFASHTLHFGEIRDEKGIVLDQVVLAVFKAPHSYTGQDVYEISSHGGMVVSKRILDLLIKNGARHAEPGEFTKRAFLNGKIDLTQAEAVLDLIKAKSDKSLETAVRQLSGSLSRKFKMLKDEMMKVLAHLEAYVDFPDEHLEVYGNKEIRRQIDGIKTELEGLIASFQRGSIIREGISAVLVGKPNVGKSSLFNALLERDRALVSEYPGTTRDTLEEAIEIGGIYVRLLDTAGLHLESQNPLDKMGMERTREVLNQGSLFLYMVDGSSALEESDRKAYLELPTGKTVIPVINKCDLPLKLDLQDLQKLTGHKKFIHLSTLTREGIGLLSEKILEQIEKDKVENEGEQITRLRHRNALEKALGSIQSAREALAEEKSLEFAAYDLKSALDELRELLGEIYSEDLLDVIFAEFCIGK